ncbi:DUF6766 family protein [Micromonospora sp. NPDC047644]|uniref:DUF6766 family protein n=1 Tax=Micromonospora sp. NPDC047644 TaxID=3157203 RepID=UPI0034519AA6
MRRALFSRSLGLVLGAIFMLSWLAQSITGVAAYNEHQLGNLPCDNGGPRSPSRLAQRTPPTE